ncbi:hypothetical protein AcW1_003278 [Taiwanofungus camphoratus]|nr:hypothetical protein AcW1_003278 [Antrodia cinnamomea]
MSTTEIFTPGTQLTAPKFCPSYSTVHYYRCWFRDVLATYLPPFHTMDETSQSFVATYYDKADSAIASVLDQYPCMLYAAYMKKGPVKEKYNRKMATVFMLAARPVLWLFCLDFNTDTCKLYNIESGYSLPYFCDSEPVRYPSMFKGCDERFNEIMDLEANGVLTSDEEGNIRRVFPLFGMSAMDCPQDSMRCRKRRHHFRCECEMCWSTADTDPEAEMDPADTSATPPSPNDDVYTMPRLAPALTVGGRRWHRRR